MCCQLASSPFLHASTVLCSGDEFEVVGIGAPTVLTELSAGTRKVGVVAEMIGHETGGDRASFGLPHQPHDGHALPFTLHDSVAPAVHATGPAPTALSSTLSLDPALQGVGPLLADVRQLSGLPGHEVAGVAPATPDDLRGIAAGEAEAHTAGLNQKQVV